MSPMGPGKYDDLCTYVREQSKAHSAMVMVFDGERGTGFSFQANLETLLKMPAMLRWMADQLEQGNQA